MSPEEEAKLDSEDQVQIEDIDGWLTAIAAQIAERCPNVQILASYQTDRNDTVRFFVGTGDHYARLGLADSFLRQVKAEENERSLYTVMRAAIHDSQLEDDGEDGVG